MQTLRYKNILVRVATFVVITALACVTPWWLPFVCMGVCVLRFGWYELALVGVVLDVLFVNFSTASSMFGPFTAGGCLVAFCLWYLRARVRSVAY